jgi:CRP/FNR family transcriptional regulator/CRP/FNR family cyclic AMP-dependent transcriptional regulator
MLSTLKQSSLFSELEDAELALITNLCLRRKVPKGSILFYAGDPGNSCYMLLDGKIKIVVNADDGREHILGLLGPHDLFGEMSLLDGEPRSASAIAVEESNVVVIQRDDFLKVLADQPLIPMKLLAVLSRRLRRTDGHVESLAFLSAPGRVARLLLNLAEDLGKRTPEGLVFESRMTRQEMANLTGTSRETLTRVLMDYQDRGLVFLDRNQYVLKDEAKLRNLIN